MEVLWLGHFVLNKTANILKEHFYWPKMGSAVHKVSACSICHKAKSQFHQGLFIYSTPVNAALGRCMDFIVALPKIHKGKDAIMVVVDRFSKIEHFIQCHKTDNASHIAKLYFKEVIRLHGMSKSIVSNRDS